MQISTAIHVVSVVDNHYVQHLGVAFASMLRHLSPGAKAHLYVIEDGLTGTNRAMLAATVAKHGAALTFRSAKGRIGRELFVSGHMTEAVYYKVLIPDLLADVPTDKIIYLDCDVVVLADIRELWETDLRGYAVAAVRDPGGSARSENLGLPAQDRYFNAGVLVLDLKRWRERKLGAEVLNYAGRHAGRLVFHDQDALNAVLGGEWLALDPKWNWQTSMLTRRFRKRVVCPGIVHFTGSSKPWHYDNDHPFKPDYFRFLRTTEWRAYRPERNAGSYLKKAVKLLFPRRVIERLGRIKARIKARMTNVPQTR